MRVCESCRSKGTGFLVKSALKRGSRGIKTVLIVDHKNKCKQFASLSPTILTLTRSNLCTRSALIHFHSVNEPKCTVKLLQHQYETYKKSTQFDMSAPETLYNPVLLIGGSITVFVVMSVTTEGAMVHNRLPCTYFLHTWPVSQQELWPHPCLIYSMLYRPVRAYTPREMVTLETLDIESASSSFPIRKWHWQNIERL